MAAANLIPVGTARRYRALPVGYVDRETLLVAIADPTNVLAVDDIQIATGMDCRVAVAAEEDIEALIGRLNTLQSAVSEAVSEEEEGELAEVAELEVGAEDAPVVKLVYSILGQAVGEGASDVHFEAAEGQMRVRFRIDGVLREAAHVPSRMINAVVSRIKIMSDLNIAEKRVPQDGRVSVTVEDRRVDLRITTLPTQRGEGATIRILDKENAKRSLDELGMDGTARQRFEASFRQAYGAVLVTGPTGSGKSTTLAAIIDKVNEERNGHIITIEDPIEFTHHHKRCVINQREVYADAVAFAEAVRAACARTPTSSWSARCATWQDQAAERDRNGTLTGHLMLLMTPAHRKARFGAITRSPRSGSSRASPPRSTCSSRPGAQLTSRTLWATIAPQPASEPALPPDAESVECDWRDTNRSAAPLSANLLPRGPDRDLLDQW